mgnify:CR=1 FL=1
MWIALSNLLRGEYVCERDIACLWLLTSMKNMALPDFQTKKFCLSWIGYKRYMYIYLKTAPDVNHALKTSNITWFLRSVFWSTIISKRHVHYMKVPMITDDMSICIWIDWVMNLWSIGKIKLSQNRKGQKNF